MDAVSLIVGAVVAGASATMKVVASAAIKDAYAGLKHRILERYRSAGVGLIEQDPSSRARELVLTEDLQKAGAGGDEELVARAQVLLEAIERQPPEQAAALGVDLEQVKAANIRAKEIIAAGTGFRAKDVELTGDIELGTVRTGIDGQKNG